MEPGDSLPGSQDPATCLYPEPDRSSPCPTFHLSKNRFNITLLSAPGFSKWSPFLTFPHENPVCASALPHTCYISCPSVTFLTEAINAGCGNVRRKSLIVTGWMSLWYQHIRVVEKVLMFQQIRSVLTILHSWQPTRNGRYSGSTHSVSKLEQ
jgi:hypothetical protein